MATREMHEQVSVSSIGIPNNRCECFNGGNCNGQLSELINFEGGKPNYFHVKKLEKDHPMFQGIEKKYPELVISKVFQIHNSCTNYNYNAKKKQMQTELGKEYINNEKLLYHGTNKLKLYSILNGGLRIQNSVTGNFFGPGSYFTDNIHKANNYSKDKSNPDEDRIILVVKVNLGREKNYRMGDFDRSLKTAPDGFDSVSGFINGNEFVVYNNNQMDIQLLIVYRYINPEIEKQKSKIPYPPNITGPVARITASLKECTDKWFKTLHEKGIEISEFRKKFNCLLRHEISIDTFFKYADTIITISEETKIGYREEFLKCSIDQNSSVNQKSLDTNPNVTVLKPSTAAAPAASAASAASAAASAAASSASATASAVYIPNPTCILSRQVSIVEEIRPISKSPFNRIITHQNYQHNKKRINQNVDDDDDDDEEELNTPHINKTKKM
jgi:hypothetical protein